MARKRELIERHEGDRRHVRRDAQGLSQPTKSTYIADAVKTIAGRPGALLPKVKTIEEIATAGSS